MVCECVEADTFCCGMTRAVVVLPQPEVRRCIKRLELWDVAGTEGVARETEQRACGGGALGGKS